MGLLAIFNNFHHILSYSYHIQHLVHICASILVQLVTAREDDECDLAVAEDRELVRLLHHPKLPLVKSHLRLFVVIEVNHCPGHLGIVNMISFDIVKSSSLIPIALDQLISSVIHNKTLPSIFLLYHQNYYWQHRHHHD